MTQNERWLIRYNEVKAFIEVNHRNPSRHRIEEHDMLNWLKANRKLMNADALKEPRLSKFKELLALVEEHTGDQGDRNFHTHTYKLLKPLYTIQYIPSKIVIQR